MALYFECRINKNAFLQSAFLGDFSHLDRSVNVCLLLLKCFVILINEFKKKPVYSLSRLTFGLVYFVQNNAKIIVSIE